MGVWDSLVGSVRIRIISADMERAFADINDAGITLKHTVYVDDLHVEATVLRYHYRYLENLLEHRGDAVELLSRTGLYWTLTSLRKRPTLLIGLILYLALSVFLPTRILFVTVAGNNTVSGETIVSKAEGIGIHFGASRRTVRSERVKNALLAAIPELQWAGVNTYGCVAVISVQERTQSPESTSPTGVRSVVAKCDGIVQEVTVTRGNVLCKVGDVVKKGQVLVSGYTDCGITIKATAAEAEIYAQTVHSANVISPLLRLSRVEKGREERKISLIVGKKLIKLYNDSGISDTSCVKMYHEYYMTLPGGFRLPLGLAVETQTYYATQQISLEEDQAALWTVDQSRYYQNQNMLAGHILAENISAWADENVLHLIGEYYCYEMIGQIYHEEIIKGNE